MQRSLVDLLVQSPIATNQLIQYLEVILLLLKKYGKRLYRPSILQAIHSIEPWIASLLRLLHTYAISTPYAIQQLCTTIKRRRTDYIPQFTVFSPKEEYVSHIQHQLQQQFSQCRVHHQPTLEVGIEITGEWWHYKRHLDQDIEKLLW